MTVKKIIKNAITATGDISKTDLREQVVNYIKQHEFITEYELSTLCEELDERLKYYNK